MTQGIPHNAEGFRQAFGHPTLRKLLGLDDDACLKKYPIA